jgi:hypothetical protein
MVYGLELLDDGTSLEVDLKKSMMKSDKVYCVVDKVNKKIHLWTGQKADVRQRFVAALTASKLRTRYGLDFRVKPLNQGEESPSFLRFLIDNS